MELCTLGKVETDRGENVICSGRVFGKDEIDSTDLRLIKIRSGIKKKKKNICKAHIKKWVDTYSSHQVFCCNPFESHPTETKGPRAGQIKAKGNFEISLELRDKAKCQQIILVPGKKLCTSCKMKLFLKLREEINEDLFDPLSSPSLPSSSQQLSSQPLTISSSQSSKSPALPTSSPFSVEYEQSHLDLLNQWLVLHDEVPIDMHNLKHQKLYLVKQLDKVRKILEVFKGTSSDTLPERETVESWYGNALSFQEILKQLQEYFQSCTSYSEKVCALSVLPKSWSTQEVANHFDASSRMIRLTKSLVDKKGLLCTPNPKGGKPLPDEIVSAVKEFYCRQDISRELPGKNNYVSIKENGKRVRKTKRLVLGNLSHIYDLFHKEFPNFKISLSKFAALRPRECCLAGKGGMHNICVCTIHENPKLMFSGAHLKSLTGWTSVSDCLKILVCSDPSANCYLRTCEDCPQSSALCEKLEAYFDEAMVESVTFNQWVTTDRSNIVTMTSSVDQFIEDFTSKAEILVTHQFISNAQTDYLRELKENLKSDKIIVLGDFSENFTFVVQDSAQGFYFSNRQATLHPFMCYFKNPETNEMCQSSFVVISDFMKHNTTAVYTFQRKLMPALKTLVKKLRKIYFSDGAAGQYKNKSNVSNIWFHEQDFGVLAEWHFLELVTGSLPVMVLAGL